MTQGREAFLSTLNPQLYTIPATSPATAGGVLFPRGFFWAFGLWVRTAWADFFIFVFFIFTPHKRLRV